MRDLIRKAAAIALGLIAVVGTLLLLAPGPEPAEAQTLGARWECSKDSVGATLTLCAAAPTSGEARYITDIVAQSSTSTAGLMLLQTGTGTNCGTSTVSLFPSSAAVVRIAYPANTAAPTFIGFRTPLRVPPNQDLCVLGTGTNTVTIQMEGYVAP